MNASRTSEGVRLGQIDPRAPLLIPCGRCVKCRVAQSQQWALRCVLEAQMHERSCFLTLTYDKDNLPIDGSLRLDHWQNFAKKVRRDWRPFRFFMCGEYGDENLRPHYHALMFGLDFSEERILLRRSKSGDLFTSKPLADAWGKGMVAFGNLTFESAAYVARYCMKKLPSKNMPSYGRVSEHGEYYEVKREFATMSRNPGIGATWLDKFLSDVYPSDELVHEGRKFRPSRYFDQRIDPAFLEGVKEARLAKSVEVTRERMEVIEECAERRLTFFRREL